MITALLNKHTITIALSAAALSIILVQSMRLQSAQHALADAQQQLRMCNARAANLEQRRAIEDNVAREPNPVDRLREWQRSD